MTFVNFYILLIIGLSQSLPVISRNVTSRNVTSRNVTSRNMTECIEEYCKSQAVKCFADKVCNAGILCASECTTNDCATECINTHMNLAMLALGSCANSHGCLPSNNLTKHTRTLTERLY